MASPSVTYQEFLAYAAGQMSEGEAERIRDHLRSEPAAAETVRLYQLASRGLAADDSVAPPAAIAARAKALFDRSRAPAAERLLDRAGAIVASLLFDSRLQPAAVRAVTTSNRIQLAYEASAVDIDVIAESSGGVGSDPRRATWRLMGQAASDAPIDGMSVALHAVGEPETLMKTKTDEHGGFDFSDVPSGRYELRLEFQTTILVPVFELP